MADQNSSIGNHLAELYNSIHIHNQHVEDAKAKVQEAEKALAKVKSDFADYLKQQGIDKLLAPTQTEAPSNGGKTGNGVTKERKTRTSSDELKSQYEINKAKYKPEHYDKFNGVNTTTGLPIMYKGRSAKNQEIAAQMTDDNRDYEALIGGFTEENHPESLADKESAENQSQPDTAPKAASKSKSKAKAEEVAA
jgi:hypothetical protein